MRSCYKVRLARGWFKDTCISYRPIVYLLKPVYEPYDGLLQHAHSVIEKDNSSRHLISLGINVLTWSNLDDNQESCAGGGMLCVLAKKLIASLPNV